MKIAIASDHAGYALKEAIIKHYEHADLVIKDLGTHSEDRVDYPDFGKKIGEVVSQGDYDFGIAICGTGIGISIAANKVKGIRAALIYDQETARLAKKHNNANIIAFGGRTTSLEKAVVMIEAFRHETFEERHQQRLNKIKGIEEKG